MCGRVTEAPILAWSEYIKALGFDLWSRLSPSYNVTPTQTLACVRHQDGERTAFVAEWGLIPSWAKDRKIGATCSNARCDTVASKPAFRSAFKRRRCLVVVNGFYEWDQTHVVKGKPKQPYYFTLTDGNPWTFAGLWESWRSPEDEEVTSCTIITAGPNEIMEPFHDRTPVQLPPQFWDDWLDETGEPTKLQALLTPYDSKKMQCWPVSSRVNSTRKGDYVFGPECIAPITVPPTELVQQLF